MSLIAVIQFYRKASMDSGGFISQCYNIYLSQLTRYIVVFTRQ